MKIRDPEKLYQDSDPGVKKALDPRSRIRNTGPSLWFWFKMIGSDLRALTTWRPSPLVFIYSATIPSLFNKILGNLLKFKFSLLWIRDPRSGMGKNLDPGSRINIPDPQHWLGHLIWQRGELTPGLLAGHVKMISRKTAESLSQIPDPGSSEAGFIKKPIYFGSGIFSIPDHRSRGQKGTRSRIRNSGCRSASHWCGSGSGSYHYLFLKIPSFHLIGIQWYGSGSTTQVPEQWLRVRITLMRILIRILPLPFPQNSFFSLDPNPMIRIRIHNTGTGAD
jgi:hypothetical protein